MPGPGALRLLPPGSLGGARRPISRPYRAPHRVWLTHPWVLGVAPWSYPVPGGVLPIGVPRGGMTHHPWVMTHLRVLRGGWGEVHSPGLLRWIPLGVLLTPLGSQPAPGGCRGKLPWKPCSFIHSYHLTLVWPVFSTDPSDCMGTSTHFGWLHKALGCLLICWTSDSEHMHLQLLQQVVCILSAATVQCHG